MSLFYTDGPCPWCKSQKFHPLSRRRLMDERGTVVATCVDCQRVWAIGGQDHPEVPDDGTITVGKEPAEQFEAVQLLLSWLRGHDKRKTITFTRQPRGRHAERV